MIEHIAKFKEIYGDDSLARIDQERALNEVLREVNKLPLSDGELAIEYATEIFLFAGDKPIMCMECGQTTVFYKKFGHLVPLGA